MKSWIVVIVFAAACGGSTAEPAEPTPVTTPAAESSPTTAPMNSDHPAIADDSTIGAFAGEGVPRDDEPEEQDVASQDYMPTGVATIAPEMAMNTGNPMCDLSHNRYVQCVLTSTQLPRDVVAELIGALEQSRVALESAFAGATPELEQQLDESCKMLAGAYWNAAQELGCDW